MHGVSGKCRELAFEHLAIDGQPTFNSGPGTESRGASATCLQDAAAFVRIAPLHACALLRPGRDAAAACKPRQVGRQITIVPPTSVTGGLDACDEIGRAEDADQPDREHPMQGLRVADSAGQARRLLPEAPADGEHARRGPECGQRVCDTGIVAASV